eukprot:7380294-Prymnesium_polylepis.1
MAARRLQRELHQRHRPRHQRHAALAPHDCQLPQLRCVVLHPLEVLAVARRLHPVAEQPDLPVALIERPHFSASIVEVAVDELVEELLMLVRSSRICAEALTPGRRLKLSRTARQHGVQVDRPPLRLLRETAPP